jgi:cytochrome P450
VRSMTSVGSSSQRGYVCSLLLCMETDACKYSGKENLHLESDIDARIAEFIALIRANYLSTPALIKPMDLARKVQYLTLDVISALSLGEPFGMLTRDEDTHGYIKSGEEGLWICNLTLGLGINWIIQIPWIGKLLLPSDKDVKGFGKMIGTAFKMVDKRVERANSTNARSDMLASFIKNGLAGRDLKSEALEVILAGSDTTASGIRGVLLYILTNPRVYKKLQAEIDETAGKGWSGSSKIIPEAIAKSQTYLQAVIKEGLRMFPPVVNIFSRDVPSGGDTVVIKGESYHLPEGTSLGYSAWGMHHDKSLYGEDAKSFRPERWLIEDKELLKEMNRVNELIFGYGRWKCLGMPIAMSEIGKAIFEVSFAAFRSPGS